MKKTIKSLLALAAVAFTFAACSDVPEPYPTPGSTPKEEIGDGTEEEPLTVSKAVKKGSSTGAFVKGYIVGYIWGTKADVGAVFGAPDTATVASNILFAESADETSVSKCMPVQLPVGAVRTALNLKDNKGMYKKEVTLYGTIEKYFGNTGMKQVSYAIADGQTYGTKPSEPEPEGEVQTVTIAAFNAAPVSTTNWYQLTGTIKNLKDGDQYGNFDIEDATGSVYVYGLTAEKGGASKKFQELVAAKGIANGKKITIIGKRGEYNSKIEVLDAYFVSIEGEATPDPEPQPTGDTDGSEAKPYTVADAIAAASGTEKYVKAYIVGWIDGQVLSSGAHFDGNATVASNILIADSPDETDVAKCMPVQLPSGAVRTAVNLKDKPDNYKKEILLNGNIEKYFGVPGIKSTGYAKIGDTEAGTKPGGSEGGEQGGGGDTPPSGDAQAVTIAQFNAAAVSNDVWYQLTGTISNLKDGDKYGNFDLTDETGSVYVYGLLSEKGGAKQKFQDLVTAKGVANGKKITIIGNRGEYKDKIEVVNAYFVSIE